MTEKCRLCDQVAELQESHIIPKLFFNYLKKTSATGKLRNSKNINKRSQDGLKVPFLCQICEQKLAKWEDYFKREIFDPLQKGKHSVDYDERMLKFCVSVTWRVLLYYVEQGHAKHVAKYHSNELTKCLSQWKEFLLGKEESPGVFEHHFYNFIGEVFGDQAQLPSNINRYLQRSIDFDVIANASDALVYVKLPGIIILGCIKLNEQAQWKNMQVSSEKGKIEPKKMECPMGFLDYIRQRAEKANYIKGTMSNNQKEKIRESYQKQIDSVIMSETFKALKRDIDHFGEDEVFKDECD